MIWSPSDHTENPDNLTAMNLSHLWMNNLCNSLGTSIFQTHFPGNTSKGIVHFCLYQAAPLVTFSLLALWFEYRLESLKINIVKACQWVLLLEDETRLTLWLFHGVNSFFFSVIRELHWHYLENFSCLAAKVQYICILKRKYSHQSVCNRPELQLI